MKMVGLVVAITLYSASWANGNGLSDGAKNLITPESVESEGYGIQLGEAKGDRVSITITGKAEPALTVEHVCKAFRAVLYEERICDEALCDTVQRKWIICDRR